MTPADWPAITEAHQADAAARVPFHIRDAGRARPVGSVARAHLGALARCPDALEVDAWGVTLR